MTFTENKIGAVRFMTTPTISARHAFTTRFGGVSEGIYASMNLGTGRGDGEERIRENYRLLGEATGIDVSTMAFTKQVHRTDVRIATMADVHELFTEVPYEADGNVIGVAKGNTDLMKYVNEALHKCVDEGTFNQYLEKANTLAAGEKYEGMLDSEGNIPEEEGDSEAG